MMHVLRHTAASAWLSAGISVGAVAEFLGDTESTVQATYSHMMPDDRERARKAMERFFTRPTEGQKDSAADDVP
jgi:integrase